MLQSLPSEILMKTFGYLPPESLFNMSEISTTWSPMATKLGACRLDFSRMDHDQLESEDKMIAHIKNEIPTFTDGANIRYLFIASQRLVSSTVFQFLQLVCPNVTSFDYDYYLLEDSNSWHSQRHSSLLSCAWQKSITHLPACFNGVQILSRDEVLCQRLESLYIGRDGVSELQRSRMYHLSLRDHLPQLTSLTLHAPFNFDETMISEIHGQCPRLRNLTLRETSLSYASNSSASSFSRPYVMIFIKYELKVLKLENVTLLNYATFCFFPDKYPNVTTLRLSTNHQNYYQQFGKQLNYKSVRECIYEMIISFKCLTKLEVHLNGFGQKEDPVNVLYQDQIEAYFSKILNKRIQVQVTYS